MTQQPHILSSGDALKTPRVCVGLSKLFVGDRGGRTALQNLVNERDTRSLGIIIWASSDNPFETAYMASAMSAAMSDQELYEYIIRITCDIRHPHKKSA